MRILTFNWHEAYICTLAKTGHTFDVVERQKGGSGVWFYETRPLPPNARIVKEATARMRVREGTYDAVVCQNIKDLLWVREFPVSKVLVFHNMLTTEIALGGHTVDRDRHRAEVADLVSTTDALRLVFISETKRRDWDLDGVVVLPGVDLSDYGGYRGEDARVLRVGNFMKRRDVMLGHTAQVAILGDRPSTLLGLNEPEDRGRFTRSWDDLKEAFRSHRVFLNTTVDGFEDGYNLSMLEAMATGMPVVSTNNRTSPIVDGHNGCVSDDLEYLSSQVDRLLESPSLAATLGAEARCTVDQAFPMSRFVERWNGIFADCARQPPTRIQVASRVGSGAAPARAADSSERGSARKRILLGYVSYPATTARYLEASLRRVHDVITTGPAIDDHVIASWNLQNMQEPVKAQDVPTGFDVDMEQVMGALPPGWTPDLFVWVESVDGYFPRQIPALPCPTACYLIDSHLNLPWHLEWATRFDQTFVAQREYRSAFDRAGVPRVDWLPLACDPDIHGRQDVVPQHDVGFVGSQTEYHVRRRRLLDRLGRCVRLHVERSFLHEMARTYSASKIVFNDAVKNDLNMRVFEVLASGAMLLTDRAPGSGLDEMFIDREHLVIYDDADIEELAVYYLAHDEERQAIARRGREEVLRWHTYDHRAATLVDAVFAPDLQNTLDERSLGDVRDPLVLEVADLAARRQFDAALTRAELVGADRELAPHEWLTLRTTVATCLRANGRPDDARTVALQAVRDLPAPMVSALLAL